MAVYDVNKFLKARPSARRTWYKQGARAPTLSTRRTPE